ncbi:MAG TPA: hypothetical protein VM366_08150 [Anaerolineae bacterium]|nr:hypothetical protein [Anaerolineae bacterium]
MFEGNLWNATEVAKLETAQAERRAAESHRFRDIKTPEAKVLTAIITSVLGLFLR